MCLYQLLQVKIHFKISEYWLSTVLLLIFIIVNDSWLLDYICDKQVLWESAGAFFPRDNSFQPASSHSSGVLGLVVRYLLFNPDVPCWNRCVCANFFTRIPKGLPIQFFRHYETSPFFGFETIFSKIFYRPRSFPPSFF